MLDGSRLRFYTAVVIPFPLMILKRLAPFLVRPAWAVALLVVAGCGIAPQLPPAVGPGELPKVIAPAAGKASYTRCVQTKPDTFVMQTGGQVFRHRSGRGPEVVLLGSIHIGEAAYYRDLQRRMDAADAVLYEQVIDEKQPLSALTPEQRAARQAASTYAKVARMMGLYPQHSQLAYHRRHYQRCDLTVQQMHALLDAEVAAGGKTGRDAKQAAADSDTLRQALHGESWVVNFALWLADRSTAVKTRLKFRLVVSSAKSDGRLKVSPRLSQLITEDRNHHVIQELARQLRRRPQVPQFLIFYGAAHLPGMAQELRGIGYTPAGPVEWLTAVTSHPYAGGLDRDEVRRMTAP